MGNEGFGTSDRKMMVDMNERSIRTDEGVKFMKEAHEERLEDLEDEDKILHGRINRVNRAFTMVVGGATAIGASIGAWLKFKTGGQ